MYIVQLLLLMDRVLTSHISLCISYTPYIGCEWVCVCVCMYAFLILFIYLFSIYSVVHIRLCLTRWIVAVRTHEFIFLFFIVFLSLSSIHKMYASFDFIMHLYTHIAHIQSYIHHSRRMQFSFFYYYLRRDTKWNNNNWKKMFKLKIKLNYLRGCEYVGCMRLRMVDCGHNICSQQRS